jgi:hypothetical protein
MPIYLIAYRYKHKTQEKNEATQKVFHAGIERSLRRQNSDPWQGYEEIEDSPFGGSLLSESQIWALQFRHYVASSDGCTFACILVRRFCWAGVKVLG